MITTASQDARGAAYLLRSDTGARSTLQVRAIASLHRWRGQLAGLARNVLRTRAGLAGRRCFPSTLRIATPELAADLCRGRLLKQTLTQLRELVSVVGLGMSSLRTHLLVMSAVVAGCVVAGCVAVGCGPTIYTINIMPAARAVEQAREAQAPEHAPYEYYYAEAHLRAARQESAEASYEDAIRYAGVAEEFGTKALDIARRRMRELGR